MIHESRYWKIPLLRGATWLAKLVVDDDNSEVALARAEREIFIGFYTVRKLLPTFKLSHSTKTLKAEVEWYPPTPGEEVDYFHRTEVDELFDLDSATKESRDIGFLCNQVIHSYVFLISLTEDQKIAGFYLASDTMRKKRLYFVTLETVLTLFRTVGRDYPTEGHFYFNDETREWEAGAK